MDAQRQPVTSDRALSCDVCSSGQATLYNERSRFLKSLQLSKFNIMFCQLFKYYFNLTASFGTSSASQGAGHPVL